MNIINRARAFGCHNLVLLDGDPTPRDIDYLDYSATVIIVLNECTIQLSRSLYEISYNVIFFYYSNNQLMNKIFIFYFNEYLFIHNF